MATPTSRFATRLDPHLLRLAFAAFLAILSAIVAYRTWRGLARSPDRRPLRWGWSAAVGAVGGIVSGLFGVGGAFRTRGTGEGLGTDRAGGSANSGAACARLAAAARGGPVFAGRYAMVFDVLSA